MSLDNFPRVESCACGGLIHAASLRDMQRAVADHVRSLTHAVWRAHRELRER